MKTTKNLNGAARVAVQATLDAADKELHKARDLVQQRTKKLELDIAEGQIQYHKELVTTMEWVTYALCGVVVVLAWKLSQHIGWFGGVL